MSSVKAILFDLGGVLVNFTGLDNIRDLMPARPQAEDIRSRWITSPAISAFERGDLSPGAFATNMVEEWELQVDPQRFLEIFTSWIKGTLPGTEALLADLRPRFTLACLSNTNELHWEKLLNDCGLGSQLHNHYASHLIGRLKPDPDAFRFVCEDLGFAPHEIIFFDDGEENVSGAEQFGLSACKVHNPSQIRAKIADLGLSR